MLAPAPEPDDDSLFMPAGDDDERRWDPPNFDNDPEEEEMLGWDASNEMRGTEPHPTFRDSGRSTQPARQEKQTQQTPSQWEDGLEPTQRLSQVRLIMMWLESSVANMNPASWNVRLMALLSRLVRFIAYDGLSPPIPEILAGSSVDGQLKEMSHLVSLSLSDSARSGT